MPITKLTALEREAARLEGERGALEAAIAQTEGRMAEIELQALQVDRDLVSDVSRELREVEGRLGELAERQIAAEDQLKRTEIRAPQAGVVHQSIVHTVEARVALERIDQLRVGHGGSEVYGLEPAAHAGDRGGSDFGFSRRRHGSTASPSTLSV